MAEDAPIYANDRNSGPYASEDTLSPKQIRFVNEYQIDLKPGPAAIRAGYRATTAYRTGVGLLKLPKIQKALQELFDARAFRTTIMQDAVLERWWQIATANPNDVVQYRRIACRFCHGIDFFYQWKDEREYADAVTKAAAKKQAAPDMSGGFGYSQTADPHPDCPSCAGEGYGRVHISDSRNLTGAAALLYAGAEEGRNGVTVKIHDQMKALENVAKHLGMFKDRVELSGPNGAAISMNQTSIDTSRLTLDELREMERMLLKCADPASLPAPPRA